MAAFLLMLSLLLEGLSWLAVEMGRSRDPLYNYSTTSFFAEPKGSIDVLVIGTSDVYSSVAPLVWWDRYGFTGYAWGEASQRIFETYNDLKRIYRVQRPKVVLLEIGNLYRDATRAQVLDSMVKAGLAQVFPIISCHHNLDPRRLSNLGAPLHSVTKGYFLRAGAVPATGSDRLKKGGNAIDPLCQAALRRCLTLCESHGSKVILLSVPTHGGWNARRHRAVADLAKKWDVAYLDLNETLQSAINWKTDTPDGGTHLNYRGAAKVTAWLGEYLHTAAALPDHRQDAAYAAWNHDWTRWDKSLYSWKKEGLPL
jgi:hypothetical protein